MTATITAPASVEIINAKNGKPPRFRVLVYSGAKLTIGGWSLPVLLNLETMKFYDRQIRVNLDHQADKRLGHVDSHEIVGNKLYMSGVFSAATEWRDEVLQSHRDGFKWEVSLEADPGELTEIGPETITANGRTHEGPLFLANGSLFTGFAFVTRGADPGNEMIDIAAKIEPPAIAANTTRIEPHGKHQLAFRAWLKQNQLDADAVPSVLVDDLFAGYSDHVRRHTIKNYVLNAAKAGRIQTRQLTNLRLYAQSCIDDGTPAADVQKQVALLSLDKAVEDAARKLSV